MIRLWARSRRQRRPQTSLARLDAPECRRRGGFAHVFLSPAPPSALVAQWIEHRFPKPGVAGPIPAEGTVNARSSRVRKPSHVSRA